MSDEHVLLEAESKELHNLTFSLSYQVASFPSVETAICLVNNLLIS